MLRAKLPLLANAPLCPPLVPSNGVGRVGCGLLFRGVGPSQFTITRQEAGHWEGLNAKVFDDPLGKSFPPWPPQNNKTGHSECWRKIPNLRIATGYMQAATSYSSGDINPSFLLQNDGGQFVSADWDAYSASLGNTIVRFFGLGCPATGSGQQMVASGGAVLGLEIRPSDKAVRGWSDPGGDPRETDLGATTIVGPLTPYLRAYNGQNGFTGTAGYGSVIVTKARAMNLNVPAARSVRVSVNGAVQNFPGPLGYIALPAGVGVFDPAPGIWWPSIVRLEFFNAAALGGALIADLSIPTAWGGDTIGMV